MTTNIKFTKLFEPGMIGKVKTKNRMFKTAAGTTFADSSGKVNNKLREFYKALARGGVGLILFEGLGGHGSLMVSSNFLARGTAPSLRSCRTSSPVSTR